MPNRVKFEVDTEIREYVASRTCNWCEERFPIFLGQRGAQPQFCSDECHIKYRVAYKDHMDSAPRICQRCSKKFLLDLTKPGRPAIFCSQDCKEHYRIMRKLVQNRTCKRKGCYNPTLTLAWVYGDDPIPNAHQVTDKFCSNKCAEVYYNELTPDLRTCLRPFCENPIPNPAATADPDVEQLKLPPKFCSVECRDEMMGSSNDAQTKKWVRQSSHLGKRRNARGFKMSDGNDDLRLKSQGQEAFRRCSSGGMWHTFMKVNCLGFLGLVTKEFLSDGGISWRGPWRLRSLGGI